MDEENLSIQPWHSASYIDNHGSGYLGMARLFKCTLKISCLY